MPLESLDEISKPIHDMLLSKGFRPDRKPLVVGSVKSARFINDARSKIVYYVTHFNHEPDGNFKHDWSLKVDSFDQKGNKTMLLSTGGEGTIPASDSIKLEMSRMEENLDEIMQRQ